MHRSLFVEEAPIDFRAPQAAASMDEGFGSLEGMVFKLVRPPERCW